MSVAETTSLTEANADFITPLEQNQMATIGTLLLLKEAEDILSGMRPGNFDAVYSEYDRMKQRLQELNAWFESIDRPQELAAMNGIAPYESPILSEERIQDILSQNDQESSPIPERTASPERGIRKVYVVTVGRLNSGKSIPTSLLRDEYEFIAEPLSDRLQEIAAAYGYKAPYDRDVFHTVAEHVRELYGPGVLIDSAIRRFGEPGNDQFRVHDGARTMHEVEALLEKREEGAEVILFSVSTGLPLREDQRVRFERALKRGGPKDPTEDTEAAFAKFCEQDNVEGPEIDRIIELVDPEYRLINNGSIEDVKKQVRTRLAEHNIYPLPEEETPLSDLSLAA